MLGHLISMFFIICQGCAQPPVTIFSNEIRPGAWSTEAYVPLLANKKVGVIVNQTSLIGATHLLDSLLAKGVNVVKIYDPEHGLRGQADAGEVIKDGFDGKTGIPVISLYGDKKKPQAGDLSGVDILVFDIQDVGVRFYTYISTLHYVMEAAGENNIPLVVLDRPNPNGHYIDGPLLDTVKYRSFVGMHPVPVVYGMTMGELARMIKGENWIKSGCNLTVISCTNYDHSKSYDLPVKPSPNLPNLRAVVLSPGLCFFEGTPVSIGRGTATPFQLAGHPEYPDKSFSFIPKAVPGAMYPPQEGKFCYGIDLTHADVDSLFNASQMDLTVLLDFYNKLPKESFFNASWFDKLAGGPSFRESIQKGMTEAQIRQSWVRDIEAFKIKRAKYLLYADSVNCARRQ